MHLSTIYDAYKKIMFSSDISAMNLKMMVLDDSYVIDASSHEFKSDIDALSVEISDAGYTSGGESLQNTAIVFDNVDKFSYFTSDDVSFGPISTPVSSIIVYEDTGDAATSKLIMSASFAVPQEMDNETLDISWPSDGMIRID